MAPAPRTPTRSGAIRLRRTVGATAASFLLAVGCSADAPTPSTSSPGAASVERWVSAVCDALHKYTDEAGAPSGLPNQPVSVLAKKELDHAVLATEHLAQAVELAGVPDVDGGSGIAADMSAKLRASVSKLEDAKQGVRDLPTAHTTATLDALQKLVTPGIIYPHALALLFEGDSVDIIVSLTDPVDGANVSTLTDLLEQDPAVVRVDYEDKAASCARAKRALPESVFESLDCRDIPATLRVTLAPDASPDTTLRRVRGETGVRDAWSPLEQAADFLAAAGLSARDVERLNPLSLQARSVPSCIGVFAA